MSVVWEFSDNIASADAEAWHVQVPPTQPAAGLTVRQQEQSPWKLFCVTPIPQHELKTGEVYARDADLIVRFVQSQADSFAFQINYRLLSPPLPLSPPQNHATPKALGIELWLSIQTDLLDATPGLSVASEAPDGCVWQKFSHADLLGRAASDSRAGKELVGLSCFTDGCTGVWLTDPNDEELVRLVSQPTESSQQLRLFGQFMEKGVIRRARMRFHLVEGELSASQVRDLYREFADSPLPLTA